MTTKKKARPLNARQRAFVEAYTNPNSRGFGNATQAATLAGYSERTADAQGARLLKNVKIQTLIEQRQAAAAERAEFDRAEAIKRALEQSDAWLDPKTRSPKVEKVQRHFYEGEEVAADVYYARPSSAEVNALELAARVAGHLNEQSTQVGQLNYVVIAPPMAETPEEWYERYKDQIAARTQGREVPTGK